jgi:energy-coupling factor transport system substrate-specific component
LQEIIAQQMAAPPPPLHARFPDISPDVEEAVMMALAKDPYQRFDTVEAFAHALEEANRSQNAPAGVLLPAPPRQISPAPPLAVTEQAVPGNFSAVQRPSRMQAPQQQVMTVAHTPPRYARRPREEQPRDRLKPGDQAGRGAAMSPARQLFTMLAGIILYGIFYYLIIRLELQNKALASQSLFSLSIIIPMFFGAAFGPAVGLVTAIGGYLIGHSFLSAPQYWNNAIGTALTGLITGFAILKTHGSYRRPKALATAVLFALLGILIGEGFTDCTSMWVVPNTAMNDALSNFLFFSIFEGISAVILLPILLGIYGILSRSGKRA